VRKLAGAWNLMPLSLRSTSSGLRGHASRQNAVARVIAAIVVAALLLSGQTQYRLRRELSDDAFRSASPSAALSILNAMSSHRAVVDSRSPSRWAIGLDRALPSFVQPTLVRDADRNVATLARTPTSPRIAIRGYDATAPPALS